jgi:hypothetical protein
VTNPSANARSLASPQPKAVTAFTLCTTLIAFAA